MDLPQIYSNITVTMAFFLGAIHAFSPGHGKAVLAAYLIGSRGRILNAIWLGLVIAVSHTFTIIVLGFVIKIAHSAIMSAIVEPKSPDAEPVPVPGAKIIQIIAGVLILAVGVWLMLGRRSIFAHKHDHEHDHSHEETDHYHGLWQTLLLGISGGMVPCAEGIALLLMAVAAGQTGRGFILVLAFSLGVAIVIITIGIIICRIRSLAEHILHITGRWSSRIPVISGFIISLLGCYSIAKALISL